MVKLTDSEIAAALAGAPGWTMEGGKLQREYRFPDFLGALEFVNKVALIAEEANHHPDIDVRYNRVLLGLVTHDAGGITESDAGMAARLNREIDT